MATRPLTQPHAWLPRRGPSAPARWPVALVLLAAAMVGALMAYDVKLGIGALFVLLVVPVAFSRLSLAVCAWIIVVFFGRIPSLESIPNRFLLLVAACWVAMLVDRRIAGASAAGVPVVRSRHRDPRWSIGVLAVIFVVWEALTIAWAPEAHLAWDQVKFLMYCCLGMLVVMGAITEGRHVRWLMLAFVFGAALSVLMGAAEGNLGVGNDLTSAAALASERFQGGSGDPNYLAAVIVPAIVLAGALSLRKSVLERLALALGIVILAVGLGATRSRGGLIAAGVACVVALAIWRGRRLLIASLIGLFFAALTAYFVASPAAWDRIAHNKDAGTGSGRTDVWHVALRIVEGHPIFGVGIGQFPVVSPHYVNLPGALQNVNEIVDQHIVVHNLYLQLWTETGLVGLVLFIALIVLSLAASVSAIRQFVALGDEPMAGLARATIPALAGVLTASFFLSNISDRRIWVLLALGPLLASIAARQARATAASVPLEE
jgi:O-antigen ligase